MAQRIKKGDTVLVISGKDRGVRGEVIRVLPKKGVAFVEGANVATRHSSSRVWRRRASFTVRRLLSCPS